MLESSNPPYSFYSNSTTFMVDVAIVRAVSFPSHVSALLQPNDRLVAYKTDIRDVAASFLSQCGIPYACPPYDQNLHDEVYAYGVSRGYPMDDLKRWLPVGVIIASLGYKHLPNPFSRVLIAIYTVFLTYVDDAFQEDVTSIQQFNRKFVLNQPQDDPVLDSIVDCLHEVACYSNTVASNLIITASLDFITSTIMDCETRGMQLSHDSVGYSTMCRNMSGIPVAYAAFMFAPETPICDYIQAMPDLITYINNVNDVLSFYKEECDGESQNYISLLANAVGVSKLDALRHVKTDVIEAHDRIVRILAPSKEASKAFHSFKHGYVYFHTSSRRYKLDDLQL